LFVIKVLAFPVAATPDTSYSEHATPAANTFLPQLAQNLAQFIRAVSSNSAKSQDE